MMQNRMQYRVALGVEYDGSCYHGWQKQASALGVQEALEAALSKITAETINTTCAGRTDAGVHALSQVVHFDTTAPRSEYTFVQGTNTELSKAGQSIRILWAKKVPLHFDARRSALKRRYRYIIYNHPIRPSLFKQYMTWHYRALDVEVMQKASEFWIGEHDFSSFRASACQSHSPIREMYSIDISATNNPANSQQENNQINIQLINQANNQVNSQANSQSNNQVNNQMNNHTNNHHIILNFMGNAFLHHMVRNMVGVLMTIGEGKKPYHWAKSVLDAKDRRLGGITAPPQGLYLMGVDYPQEFELA